MDRTRPVAVPPSVGELSSTLQGPVFLFSTVPAHPPRTRACQDSTVGGTRRMVTGPGRYLRQRVHGRRPTTRLRLPCHPRSTQPPGDCRSLVVPRPNDIIVPVSTGISVIRFPGGVRTRCTGTLRFPVRFQCGTSHGRSRPSARRTGNVVRERRQVRCRRSGPRCLGVKRGQDPVSRDPTPPTTPTPRLPDA